MSTSAIILMVIGCAGLWGGFGVSCAIAFRCEKRRQDEQAKAENN